MTHEATDENGANAYYEDWLWGCKIENQSGIASNGQRVTTALALQIAADTLRGFDPTRATSSSGPRTICASHDPQSPASAHRPDASHPTPSRWAKVMSG